MTPARPSQLRSRLTLLLVAALPEAATPDAVPVYLVDPEGFVVLHYRPGFDPSGLRKDLGKLIK
jgi:hypothetical protein